MTSINCKIDTTVKIIQTNTQSVENICTRVCLFSIIPVTTSTKSLRDFQQVFLEDVSTPIQTSVGVKRVVILNFTAKAPRRTNLLMLKKKQQLLTSSCSTVSFQKLVFPQSLELIYSSSPFLLLGFRLVGLPLHLGLKSL